MISKTKLVTAGAAVALFATSAIPVFASHSDDLLLKQKNWGYVKNNITATSNTGNNSIDAEDDIKGAKIKTGDAMTGVEVVNLVNSNDASVDSCGCFDDVTIRQKNGAKVKNYIDASSDTGNNSIDAEDDDVKWSRIRTGDALTGVSVASIVNSNVATVGGGELSE